MINITLSDGKEIEVLAIHFSRNCVDFRWVGGVYSGDCAFPCTLVSVEDILGQVEEAANVELVSGGVTGDT